MDMITKLIISVGISMVLGNVATAQPELERFYLGQNVKPNLVWVTIDNQVYADPLKANQLDTCVTYLDIRSNSEQVTQCFEPTEFLSEVMVLGQNNTETKIYIEYAKLERTTRH